MQFEVFVLVFNDSLKSNVRFYASLLGEMEGSSMVLKF
jgi:hypothetical protein